jgi:hypothetical protein
MLEEFQLKQFHRAMQKLVIKKLMNLLNPNTSRKALEQKQEAEKKPNMLIQLQDGTSFTKQIMEKKSNKLIKLMISK